MKKAIVFLFVASFGVSVLLSAGCRSEAKIDEDGAKVEVEGKD